jgi:uroporphyrinogen decarboxylase
MTDSLLLRALRGEELERPPVWFMRQAGRYLPEYHDVRNQVDFLTLCRRPDLAAEVTLQPLRRFGFDASIVFNDILVPPAAMGMDLEFIKGQGPVFHDPLRSPKDLDRLHVPDVQGEMPEVLETIKRLVAELEVPLFGFAGAPFTLAAYMIEGSGSKNFLHIKHWVLHHPDALHELLGNLADLCGSYLQAQADAGAAAVQLFDTWAGVLGRDDFETFVVPYAKRALAGVSSVPRLYFTRDCGAVLDRLRAVEADAYALDWRVDLAQARQVLGDVPIMGNLDPVSLYGPPDEIRRRVANVIRAAGPKGHVFNLGHGILPTTPIDGVKCAVDAVRAWRW